MLEALINNIYTLSAKIYTPTDEALFGLSLRIDQTALVGVKRNY